jgi:hypothetical protein
VGSGTRPVQTQLLKKNRYIGNFMHMSFAQSHFRVQKRLVFQGPPLPMVLVMDFTSSRFGAVGSVPYLLHTAHPTLLMGQIQYKGHSKRWALKIETFWALKGTVQPELRGAKIGINRTAMEICVAGKCRLSCPKGHHHERSINILGGCSTF